MARALQESLAGGAVFLGRREADFLRPADVLARLSEYKPDSIIIASAYTAVDKAETDREQAFQINASTPGLIGEWAAKNGARIVHFSSDYVYSGVGSHARSENEPTNPLNYYGETKLRGDQALLESGASVWILRTSWVYSHVGHNFVKTMLRLGAEREQLAVVDDQVGAPTAASDLAALTSHLLNLCAQPGAAPPTGVYHACAGGFCTWREFAQAIFEEARALGASLKVQDVRSIRTEDFPTPARRPLNSRLSCDKLKREVGFEMPPWRDSLKQCLRILHGHSTL